MLLRLLLALLVASFALPAAAAAPVCHEETPMAAMHHDAPASVEKPAHVCVGCVPLADWDGARAASPVVRDEMPRAIDVARLDLSGGAPPMLRPPRTA